MPRSRLAVALVVPEPFCTEIDGLRRAVGGDIDRIAPHVTLVPPVNVRDEGLVEALAILRSSAAVAPEDGLRLTVGPAASFVPTNRVLYLAVGGAPDDVATLGLLRSSASTGVLRREEQRPFVPHVTLTNRLSAPAPDAADGGVAAADAARGLLAGYRVEVAFRRLDLLRYDEEERRWTTVADVSLGPPRVVGRGGLALELTTSSRLDPEAAAVVDELGVPLAPRSGTDAQVLVVAARREGAVVGVATATVAAGHGWLDGLVVVPEARRTGIGAHLLATVQFEMAVRGARRASATRPADAPALQLLRERGWDVDGDTLTTTLNV